MRVSSTEGTILVMISIVFDVNLPIMGWHWSFTNKNKSFFLFVFFRLFVKMLIDTSAESPTYSRIAAYIDVSTKIEIEEEGSKLISL